MPPESVTPLSHDEPDPDSSESSRQLHRQRSGHETKQMFDGGWFCYDCTATYRDKSNELTFED
jgi:hypothetical protein